MEGKMLNRNLPAAPLLQTVFALLVVCLGLGVGRPYAATAASNAAKGGDMVAPLGPPGSWRLVFRDEFDDAPGMSGPKNGLQASKWNCGWWSGPVSPGVGNIDAVTRPVQRPEIQYYGPAGIIFPGDGSVHFRLQKGVDDGGTHAGRSLESGQITTAGLLAFNPANVPVAKELRPYTVDGPSVLEIRGRFPGPHADAGSYWAGYWMTNAGNYGGDPSGAGWPGGAQYSEEIDLVEFYNCGSLGSQGRFHLHSATEYGGMSSVPEDMQDVDMSAGYHVYTYAFGADSVKLWVDGKPVPGVAPGAELVRPQWQYPQYLILTFQAAEGAKYPTSATGEPNDMMVDYVRVWARDSG
jgi:hypothetical protein